MANNKKIVADLMQSLETNVEEARIANKESIATYAISSESMDQGSKEIASSGYDKLASIVDHTIDMITAANEEYAGIEFTAAQRKAATMVAALALDPSKAQESLKNLKPVSGNGLSVEAIDLGVDDAVDATALAVEAFDGQSVSSALYYSITYNLMAATQDAFGEAFFPTITIDPTVGGATIESEFTSLYNEISRSTDGSTDGSKFNKIPVVKAIYDNDLFSTDKNRAVPVLRTENTALFLDNLSYVETVSGEKVTTAPIKIGKDVGLLGLSQTDSMIAKGIMDNTDSLDRRLVVDKVYFSLTGKDSGGNNITEYFVTDTSILPLSNFTYTTQDHNKDLALNFTTDSVFLNTSTTTTVDGSASTLLGGLTGNHTIRVRMVLSGNGNTQRGNVAVYSNVFELIEVKDGNGNILPETSAEYTAFATALATLKLEGYTLEAYRTNSNMRTRGQLITSDRYTQIYTVPLRSGITVLAPINNATGDDNDIAKINSQITYAGIRTSVGAVKTLTDYADMLNNVTNNGSAPDVKLMGVGRWHVDTYFNRVGVDVNAKIDSLNSNDRLEDIRAVLVNYIKNEAVTAAIVSNYAVAHQTLRGNTGEKITVVIGTDPIIAQYLGGTIDIGDYNVVVVSTPNKLMRGKIIGTFGIFDSERNVKPNPLNSGQCFWSPTISTDVVRTVNGATVRELTNMPRFLHIVNLPVMFEIDVTGIDTALGKVTRNYHTV